MSDGSLDMHIICYTLQNVGSEIEDFCIVCSIILVSVCLYDFLKECFDPFKHVDDVRKQRKLFEISIVSSWTSTPCHVCSTMTSIHFISPPREPVRNPHCPRSCRRKRH